MYVPGKHTVQMLGPSASETRAVPPTHVHSETLVAPVRPVELIGQARHEVCRAAANVPFSQLLQFKTALSAL